MRSSGAQILLLEYELWGNSVITTTMIFYEKIMSLMRPERYFRGESSHRFYIYTTMCLKTADIFKKYFLSSNRSTWATKMSDHSLESLFEINKDGIISKNKYSRNTLLKTIKWFLRTQYYLVFLVKMKTSGGWAGSGSAKTMFRETRLCGDLLCLEILY